MTSINERKEEFLKNARNKHGDRFDYSNVDYINATTKVTIICPEHKEFEQQPYTHLHCDDPCPKCSYEVRKNTVRLNKEKEIWEKINSLNTDYDYSLAVYTNAKTPMTIICKTHGAFTQLPGVHANGHGCAQCGFEKTSIMRYTSATFAKSEELKAKDGLIYYIKFQDKETEKVFYKIGITAQSITERFGKVYRDKYEINVIDTLNMNIYNAYLLEQHIKKTYREKKYVVEDKKFMGRTECFCENILKDLPLKEIYNGFIK